MTTNSSSPINSKGEIDLRDIITSVWSYRKKILIVSIIFSLFGGLIGFLTPPSYTSSTTFLAQTSQSINSSTSLGNLGGLAALAGVNLNTPILGGDIPTTLYFRVIGSEPFKNRILNSKININNSSVIYKDYLTSSSVSRIAFLKKFINKNLNINFLFKNEKSELRNFSKSIEGLNQLSKDEFELQKKLDNIISVSVDKKEGTVSISVVESDPLIAAQLAKITEKNLQDWIIEYKIRNTKAQFDFIDTQFKIKQKQFYNVQNQLASFTDNNQNVYSATYLTRLDRLQAEYDLLNSVYSELAKQREQISIQLNKDTPTFSLIDPVKVPNEKTSPIISMYFFLPFLLGLFLSSFWFVVKEKLINLVSILNLKSINQHN